MNGNRRPFWEIWTEKVKNRLLKVSVISKKRKLDYVTADRRTLSKVRMNGNNRPFWEICREKVKMRPFETTVKLRAVYQLARVLGRSSGAEF